jgi:hypothetical protein
MKPYGFVHCYLQDTKDMGKQQLRTHILEIERLEILL